MFNVCCGLPPHPAVRQRLALRYIDRTMGLRRKHARFVLGRRQRQACPRYYMCAMLVGCILLIVRSERMCTKTARATCTYVKSSDFHKSCVLLLWWLEVTGNTAYAGGKAGSYGGNKERPDTDTSQPCTDRFPYTITGRKKKKAQPEQCSVGLVWVFCQVRTAYGKQRQQQQLLMIMP